ncbi:unnamed protein product [Penicillium pancosmium]
MTQLDSALGAKICGYGWYSQISSSSYDGAQLTDILNDVVSSGAVFQPAVMPTLQLDSFTASTASQVAAVLKQFTDRGVEVWLRFGHEMNYYLSAGTYHGTAAQFVSAWKLMHAAVQGNSLIKMWWSPNVDSTGVQAISQYWPGPDYVDLVGIDCYPQGTITSSSFANCYQSFYNTYSAAYSKPFAIGETGACGSSAEAWLSALMNPPSGYPNYIAMSWFEYSKECDFRIIESSLLPQTKNILLNGVTSPGSGSELPSDTCTWGPLSLAQKLIKADVKGGPAALRAPVSQPTHVRGAIVQIAVGAAMAGHAALPNRAMLTTHA